MKQLLIEEISELKAERDRITLENVRLDNQVERLIAEKESTAAKFNESQNVISLIRGQVRMHETNSKICLNLLHFIWCLLTNAVAKIL